MTGGSMWFGPQLPQHSGGPGSGVLYKEKVLASAVGLPWDSHQNNMPSIPCLESTLALTLDLGVIWQIGSREAGQRSRTLKGGAGVRGRRLIAS